MLEREDQLGDLPLGLTGLAIGIVLTGLAIMIAGLRGRSSGTLGFLAIVGILAAIPVALVTGSDERVGFLGDSGRFRVSSGEVWTPMTADEARDGISTGFGDLTVDLTQVPLGARTIDVPISASAGSLLVVVPDDAAVTGDIALTAGEIRWDVDGRELHTGFSPGISTQFRSDEVQDGDGDVDLAVRITAGAGEVRVVEENS
ncbi:LiaF domain-containing protein [Cellulomonas sp. ATA003]|uniref:LiaF domain-containing protein n=1 Tax=Cellulomonas sp. ATA003 TaxID=3073064 RepID=UPI0028731566|nr:LiaF domain-containing protein [Cellulomonas sp. ATA003]WNB86071.1 LiaF-related protein [Cellulomonas sp. ATA003]